MSFMWLVIHHQIIAGKELVSPAIMADAACSIACLYLSVVLLAGYELTGIDSLDAIGSLGIARRAWKEGRAAFGKAQGMGCDCSCRCGGPT